MQHAAYLTAAIPEPHSVLGVRMRPFSLGHLLILQRLDSAFVTGKMPTYDELAFACLVCALNYKDALAAITDTKTKRFMRHWQRKLCRENFLTDIGLRKAVPIDLMEEWAKFEAYMSQGMTEPGYFYEEDSAKSIPCPSVQIIRVTLQSKLGISDDEIMDRSWALCVADFLTLKAIDGSIDLIDEDAMAEIEKASRVSLTE